MGSSPSKKKPPVVLTCRAPVYCVRRIGHRHLLLAGGGGAAATGVTNQIETLLLTMDPTATGGKIALQAKLATQIRTDPFATMNMDIIAAGPPEEGLYYIACGQDQYCKIYETTGFIVDGSQNENQLSFGFREVGKIVTDDKADGPYQKCVAFDVSTRGSSMRLVTGGANGHVRVWSVRDLVDHRDPTLSHKPLIDIQAHTDAVDAVDVSPDGRYIVSVGDGVAHIWEMSLGKKVVTVPPPPQLAKGFRVRTIRFTPLGEKNIVLLAAFNQVTRTSNSLSYLVLYIFNRESSSMRPIGIQSLTKGEAISTLCLSQDGSLCGLGTMAGTVIIVETLDLKVLYTAPQTHGIFVTGVEFLNHTSRDVILPRELALQGSLPGPAASTRATLVSLSADQTVQVHNVPYGTSNPLSLSILHISVISLVIYFLIWMITSYI